MTRVPCKPCAAARKVFPKPMREKLEALERRIADRKAEEQRKKAAGESA